MAAAVLGVGVANLPPLGNFMDTATALAVLGFSSSQTLDALTMDDINAAFMKRMLLLRPVQVQKTSGMRKARTSRYSSRTVQVRRLNEALQYLTKKKVKVTQVEWQRGCKKSQILGKIICGFGFGLVKARKASKTGNGDGNRKETKAEKESRLAMELADELVYHLNNGHKNCRDFLIQEQLLEAMAKKLPGGEKPKSRRKVESIFPEVEQKLSLQSQNKPDFSSKSRERHYSTSSYLQFENGRLRQIRRRSLSFDGKFCDFKLPGMTTSGAPQNSASNLAECSNTMDQLEDEYRPIHSRVGTQWIMRSLSSDSVFEADSKGSIAKDIEQLQKSLKKITFHRLSDSSDNGNNDL